MKEHTENQIGKLYLDSKNKEFAWVGVFYGYIKNDIMYITDLKGEQQMKLSNIREGRFGDNFGSAVHRCRLSIENDAVKNGIRYYLFADGNDIVFEKKGTLKKFMQFIKECKS